MTKKLLSAIVSGTVLALALPAISFATPAPDNTFTAVSGTVTHNGNPVNNASVTVTCLGNILTDTTIADGTYEVDYSPAALCPDGSTANVAVTATGGLNGSNSGPVNAQTTELNVALVDVRVVPEMGIVAAATALAIGGGAFVVVRQRKLGNQA